MEATEHREALRREGDLLGAAAARADLDAPVPSCPGWSVRDLVRHIGDVHRWATAHVTERRLQRIGAVTEVAGPLPSDDGLLEWYREGHARLVEALATADPDLRCYTFLPAPSPVAFWSRRQAHETGIHRADAESASGPVTPFTRELALDGIDELLFGFLGRGGGTPPAVGTRSLGLRATDAPERWVIRLWEAGATASAGPAQAESDCTVSGTASDLHLLLWNRPTTDGLVVSGDGSVLPLWQDTVKITWGAARPAD